jgi:hypothetical protein
MFAPEPAGVASFAGDERLGAGETLPLRQQSHRARICHLAPGPISAFFDADLARWQPGPVAPAAGTLANTFPELGVTRARPIQAGARRHPSAVDPDASDQADPDESSPPDGVKVLPISLCAEMKDRARR